MSEMGDSILKGLNEALAYAQGTLKDTVRETKVPIPAAIDVQAIRKNLHLSRREFCNSFGFSHRTLEKWEQGVRVPEGAARAYLIVISVDPEMVQKALYSGCRSEQY